MRSALLGGSGRGRAVLAIAVAIGWSSAPPVVAQMMPGGQGGYGRPSTSSQPIEETSSASTEKPDAAAKKAYTAAMKSLAKAKDFETVVATTQNPDKKSKALEKMGDAYNRALDQFTEALSNKGDMVDAWNNVGYIHLRLGAYAESVDDYNHTLALRPDLLEAVLHRGEAYLAIDRVEDAKGAYLDLFYHARPLADQLMLAMQQWAALHRIQPKGMRPSELDAFDKWLKERESTAALSP